MAADRLDRRTFLRVAATATGAGVAACVVESPGVGEASDPVTIAPTSFLGSRLRALIAKGHRRFTLLEGKYKLDKRPSLPSGTTITGAGMELTTITTSLSGDVLDPGNALLLLQGVLDPAKMDTTPTEVVSGKKYVPAYSPVVGVADKGRMGAGDFFVFAGHVDATYAGYWGGSGAHETSREMLQVDSISDGVAPAATLRLKTNTLLHHTLTNGGVGTPVTCTAVTPVADVRISSLSFRCPGGSIAVGLLCDFATDVHLQEVGFEGFAMAAVQARNASRQIELVDCFSFGENNALVLGDASHGIVVQNCRTDPNGARYHAQGLISGMVTTRNNCWGWGILGCTFEHVALPFQIASAASMRIDNCRTRDSDVDELIKRSSHLGGDYARGAQMGSAVDMSVVVLDVADWILGLEITSCTFEDARSSSMETATIWWHDVRQSDFDAIEIKNTGKSPYETVDGARKFMTGIRAQDCSGRLSNFVINGCEWGFRHNSSQGIHVSAGDITVIPGSGPVPIFALTWAQTTPSVSSFQDLSIVGRIAFETTWNGADQNYLDCQQLNIDGKQFPGPLFPTLNRTAVGFQCDLFAFDSTAEDGIRKSTTGAPAAGDSNVGLWAVDALHVAKDRWGLSVVLPTSGGWINVDAAEINIGDELQAAGDGHKATVHDGSIASARVGTALSYKPAGASGTVRLGP